MDLKVLFKEKFNEIKELVLSVKENKQKIAELEQRILELEKQKPTSSNQSISKRMDKLEMDLYRLEYNSKK